MISALLSDAPELERLLLIMFLPLKIFHDVVWQALDILTFDVLQLGPYLPIQLS
jgi:hypothetical protein